MKNKAIFVSFVVLIISGLSFSIAFPSFNILFVDPDFQSFFEKSYGNPFVLYGVLLAIYPLGQVIGAPLLGDLSDQFGRNRILLFTVLGGCIGNALCLISILSNQYIYLLLSRLLTGLLCANTPICLSLIMEQFPEQQKRLKMMSNVAVINGFSWIGGVLIGALLSNPHIMTNFHPAYAFALPTILFFLTYFIARRFYDTKERTKNLPFSLRNFTESFVNIQKVFTISGLKLYYLILILWMIGWGMIFQWYNIYCSLYLNASHFKIAVSQCLNGVSSVLGGIALNKIFTRYFHYSTLIIASFIAVLVLAIGMLCSHTFIPFATCFILACFPAAVLWSSMLFRIGAKVEDHLRGKVMGVAQSSESIAFIGATLLGGFFETKLPGKLLFFALLFIISCILFDYFTKSSKKKLQYPSKILV